LIEKFPTEVRTAVLALKIEIFLLNREY